MWKYNNVEPFNFIKTIEDYRKESNKYHKPKYDALREKIQTAFKDLEFYEEEHKYFLRGKEFKSVSSVCHSFQIPQDFWEIAKRYAGKRGLDAKEVKTSWELKALLATTAGTIDHAFGEGFLYMLLGDMSRTPKEAKNNFSKEYFIPTTPKQKAIAKYWYDSMYQEEIPILAEVQIYWEEKGISGTFDKLVYSPKRKGLIIRDYKTNEEIEKSYKKPLLFPFGEYNEEPKSTYTIQLSIYQVMLELLDLEIPIVGRELVWVKDDTSYQIVPVDYLGDRLRKVL